MTRLWASVMIMVLFSTTANAIEYQWQSVRFEHGKTWSLLTDRTVKGAKVIHLSHDVSDSYPLSIMLSIIPKTSFYAERFQLNGNVSANVIAANFSWPFIQRFSKESTRDNRLISFNEILVGKTLSPGALVMVPTPQKRIFISAQTFYLDKLNYFVVGSIVTRVDQGIMRHSNEYAKRVDSAYQLLKSLSIDYD